MVACWLDNVFKANALGLYARIARNRMEPETVLKSSRGSICALHSVLFFAILHGAHSSIAAL